MTSNHNLGGNYWGYLINKDKSPAPLLDQLCTGIAKWISTDLEPKAIPELTPQKLASYYRAVGGNYDPLFLKTPNSSLSFIYQQLGCFHTLQPSDNAFEAPSIPALQPCGFVRWQTIQILLNPDENFAYLQEAVQRYDIPTPGGGNVFPKILPREAFPASPDQDMVKWHDGVGERLQREAQTWRLKASPHNSPYDRPGGLHRVSSNDDRMGESSDYFYHSARPPSSRTNRPNHVSSNDPRMTQGRRRSVPDEDLVSPTTTQRNPAPWPKYQPPKHGPSPPRDTSNSHHHHPPSSSSGSDASSEADSPQHHRSDDRTKTWSHLHLFPPHIHVHHTRRHSHDATYSHSTTNSTAPPRPRDRDRDRDRRPTTYTHTSPPSSYPPHPRNISGDRGPRVQFRDSFAEPHLSDPGNTSGGQAPGGRQQGAPIAVPNAPPMSRRWVKSADPLSVKTNLSDRERDRARREDRRFGSPARVNTVTGVGGRRYPPGPQVTSAGERAPEGWR